MKLGCVISSLQALECLWYNKECQRKSVPDKRPAFVLLPSYGRQQCCSATSQSNCSVNTHTHIHVEFSVYYYLEWKARAGEEAQPIKCLPYEHGHWSLTPEPTPTYLKQTNKKQIIINTRSTGEVATGWFLGSLASQSRRLSEFQAIWENLFENTG